MSFFVLVVFFVRDVVSTCTYYVLISADVSLAITWCSTCKNLACVMWRSGFFSHLKINRTFDAPRNVASMFSKILFWRSDNLTLDELCRPRFWHKVGLYAVGFRLSEEFYATVILPLQNVHVFNSFVFWAHSKGLEHLPSSKDDDNVKLLMLRLASKLNVLIEDLSR